MNELRRGLDPVTHATGAAPTIADLRARRARRRDRRNRHIATTSATAVGLACVVAIALTMGGGSGSSSELRSGHEGGDKSSMTSAPSGSVRAQRPVMHPSASSTASVTTQRTGPATTEPRRSTHGPGLDGTGPPPSTVAPAPGTPSAPMITSVALGPNLVGTGMYGTDGSDPSGGKGTAQVTWIAPTTDGGSPITSYWVQAMYTNGSTGPGCRVGATATTCLVKGLLANQPAEFFVEAFNAIGGGVASPKSSSVTAPTTTPNVPPVANPAVGDAATAGDGSATMNWSQPIYDGGSPITGYIVRSYRSDGVAGPTCSASASARSCLLTGLTNGTTYTFRVSAINAIGIGDPSIASNGVTPSAT